MKGPSKNKARLLFFEGQAFWTASHTSLLRGFKFGIGEDLWGSLLVKEYSEEEFCQGIFRVFPRA
jgi:hypothetical protein